jgi:hypothetical protein
LPTGIHLSLDLQPSADCRLGTPRADPAIEVADVDVSAATGTGAVTVTLRGSPFARYSASIHLVVPDGAQAAVDSAHARSYLFLPGQRWWFEVHDGVATSGSSVISAPGAAPVPAPTPQVVLGPAGQTEMVQFTIADFPAVKKGFDGAIVITTFGTAIANGPEACTANIVRVTSG